LEVKYWFKTVLEKEYEGERYFKEGVENEIRE
jgi:hypothetical protein